jgi:hypothetical protein
MGEETFEMFKTEEEWINKRKRTSYRKRADELDVLWNDEGVEKEDYNFMTVSIIYCDRRDSKMLFFL